MPVLDDDGYILTDSHAINAYLVTQYGNNNNLYPSDPKKRGLVDQRLYFDSGILFPRLIAITVKNLHIDFLLYSYLNFTCLQKPLVFHGQNQIPEEKINNVVEAYGFLNTFLDGSKWVAGDEVTIADFNIFETVRSLNVVVPIDNNKYSNILRWIEQVNELPATEVGKQGFLDFESLLKKRLEEN